MLEPEALATVQLVVFDFDGVFTDNTVYITQDGAEAVRCWRSDGLGLTRLKALGLPIYIVSTEKNPVVKVRANKLMIACKQDIKDKASAIRDICCEVGVHLSHVMFVGNDINDIPAFKIVGLPVAVADAHPEVLQYTRMQTCKAGGFGAVREICDLIFESKTFSR